MSVEHRGQRDRREFGAAVALVLLILIPSSAPSGAADDLSAFADGQPPGQQRSVRPPKPSVSPAPALESQSAPPGAPLPSSVPVAVEIPSIGAWSSLVPVGLDPEGTVQLPPVERPMQAAWYQFGPTPGERGAAVILGHVDGTKRPGIFYRLRELRAGDEVFVARRDGNVARFVVERSVQARKEHFPTESVYGNTDRAELRLITCGGPFDRSRQSYRDNVIVFAALA